MKKGYSRVFQWLALPCMELAFRIYLGLRIKGRKNVPKGGCVICPNHCQLSDPPLAALATGHRFVIRVMAKKELFDRPYLSWVISWLGAFPVDRSGSDLSAIKTALNTVKSGNKLLIFPQGTRDAGEGETKKGAAMLAVKSRAPIVPMYISENKQWRCKARVIIGEPFYPDPTEKDYGKIADDILRRIYALKEEI